MRTALAVLLIVHGACAWSFKEFLSGEWTLERQRGGQVTRAVYSLRPVGPNLEGTYYEFTDQRGAERMNERRVAVTFSDDDGRRGSFQLAKQHDTAADWEAEEASQPALRPVFEFDFAPYLGGKSWVSETRWLASNGGRLQFLTLGPDAFAISHFAAADGAEPTASTWIAFRDGASIAAGPAEGAKKKSLLHRYWMHLVFAIGLAGWRHSKAKAKKS